MLFDNKYKKDTQRKIGVVLSYSNFVIKAILQLVYVPIMLRMLGQNEYGIYQLVGSLVSYLTLLEFGFSGSYLKFYSTYKNDREKERRLNSTFLTVFLVIAVVTIVIGFFMAYNTDYILGNKLTKDERDLAAILMTILAINTGISFSANIFSAIIVAHECFVFQRAVSLLATILSPCLIVISLFLGYRSIGLVAVSVIMSVLSGLINVYYCIGVLKVEFAFGEWDVSLVKQVSHFSLFIFINQIVDMLNWNIDKYILARYAGAASIAVYSIAAQINMIFVQLSDIVASVYAPKVNLIVAEGKEVVKAINRLFVQVSRIQTIIVSFILSAFIVLGKEFIELWAGSGYDNSYYVALLLMLPAAIPLCESLAVDIQRAYYKHYFRSVVYVFLSIGNVLLSIPLAQLYGEIGTALGTTISLIIGNCIIMNIYYQKKMDLDVIAMLKNVKRIVFVLFICMSTCWCLKNNYCINSFASFSLLTLLYLVLFVVLVYFIYLNSEEKNTVNKICIRKK